MCNRTSSNVKTFETENIASVLFRSCHSLLVPSFHPSPPTNPTPLIHPSSSTTHLPPPPAQSETLNLNVNRARCHASLYCLNDQTLTKACTRAAPACSPFSPLPPEPGGGGYLSAMPGGEGPGLMGVGEG